MGTTFFTTKSDFDEMSYHLETAGFLVVRGFWNEKQVKDANQRINGWLDKYAEEHQSIPTKFPFIDIDPEYFLAPMEHPLIVKFGAQYCGEWFRFDHGIGLLQPTFWTGKDGTKNRSEAVNLHGGFFGSQGSNYCTAVGDRLWFGQLNVGIALSEQKEGDGGLCYIPGTHVLSTKRSEGMEVLKKYLKGRFDHPSLVIPTILPGDLVIFTEALIHGMAPWKSEFGLRKNIYYKFSPGFLAWRDYEEIKKYLPYAKTTILKKLLRGPFVSQYSDEPTVCSASYRSAVVEDELQNLERK